jgi:phosphate/sulfate permease
MPIGLGLVALVAYANGANDISKAIATLVGSGAANVLLGSTGGA